MDGVLGRRPPADDLRLGAGQRDVEQPQPLAGLLVGPPAAVLGPVRAAAADVEASSLLGVVEPRADRVADVSVGQGGEVDDGVLQALARMDGDELDGGGVGVEPPGALQPPSRAALGDLLAQPGQQGGQALALGQGHLVERLADVPKVGQAAVAAHLGEHPRGQAALGRGLEDRRHAADGEQLDPGPQRLGDLVGEVVAPFVDLGGRVAEEAGERRGPDPDAAVRLLERLDQRQPLDGGRGREDAAATGDHGGDADVEERLPGVGQVGVAVGDDRDVARPDRDAVVGRARGEQSPDVDGEVARDPRPHLLDGERPRPFADVLAADDADPERRACGAPTSRPSPWWASTGRTTIRSSPSAAPPSSRSNAVTRAASLRQLTDSVCFVAAVRAAWRYVVTSPPRKL